MNERRGRFAATLAVDAGGWMVANPRFHGDKPGQTKARAEAFLRSFRAMGYLAVNVGAHELTLAPKELKKLAKRHKVQLVSANIVDAKSGKPVFQPAVLRTVGGLKVGVFGLVTPTPPGGVGMYTAKGVQVTSPVAAATAAVKVLRGNGADVVVCLTALSRPQVELVGDKVAGVDLFIGSSGMELTLELSRIGKGYFVDTYTKGKYVGELLLQPGADKRRWAAANLQASLRQQRTNLQQQVHDMSEQLRTANKPGSPLKLSEESRGLMQRELVRRRAKLQRLEMELEGEVKPPEGAGRLKLTMHALSKEIDDDKKVLRAVDAYKKRFPQKPGH